MTDVRKHIVARAECGCFRVIMTTEDTARGYKAPAALMVGFWIDVAKSKKPLTVEQFSDESWKPLPWTCAACCPVGLFDGEKT